MSYTFLNAFENEDKPRKPRRPRSTTTIRSSLPPRLPNYWGTKDPSVDRTVTPQLLSQVGENPQLAEFFSLLLEHRWSQVDRRRGQRAFAIDDERDLWADEQRYEAKHAYDLQQLAFGEAASEGQTPALDGLYVPEKFKSSYREKGIKKNDPTYGVSTKELEALATAGMDETELTDFLLTKVERKLSAQEFNQESRDYKRDDFRNLEGDLSRYAVQHENRIERLAAQHGVLNPITGQPPVGKDEPTKATSDSPLIGMVAHGEASLEDKNMFAEAYDALKFSGGFALDRVTGDAGTSLIWAIDKISRPYYGVSAAMDTYFKQDSDTDKDWSEEGGIKKVIAGIVNSLPTTALAGKNPVDSWDDLDIGEILSSAKEGFTAGGFTGNNPNPVLGHEIIASNARRDPDKTIHDNKAYQYAGGFVIDVAADPLSYVGFGVGGGLVRSSTKSLSKQMKPMDEALRKTSDDVARELKDVDPYLDGLSPSLFDAGKPVDAGTIYNMLGGNFKYVKSGSQKSRVTQDVEANVDLLSSLLERQVITPNTTGSNAVRSLAQSLATRRQHVLKEFESDVYIESLRKELGDLGTPVGDFNGLLTTSRVMREIPQAYKHDRAVEKFVEETFGIAPSKLPSPLDNPKKGIFKGRITASAYQNAVRKIDELNAAGKTKEADSMKAQLDEFVEGLSDRPLHETIPELMHDYRLDPEDVKDLYGESRRLSYRDHGFKGHVDRSFSLKREIEAVQRQIANASDDKLPGLEAKLRVLEGRKGHTDYMRDLTQADVVVNLLHHKIATKKGLKTYTDQPAAKKLLDELEEIKVEKQALAEGKGSTVDAVALSLRENEVRTELKALEGPPKGEARPLNEVPESFLRNEDGTVELNVEKLKEHLPFDKFAGHFRINKTGDEATDKWLREVHDLVDVRYQDNFRDRFKRMMEPARKEEAKRNKQFKVDDEYEDLKNSIAPGKTPKAKKGWSKEYQTEYFKNFKQARQESADFVYKELGWKVKRGELNSGKLSSQFELFNAPVTEQEMIRALKWKQGEERAQAIIEANLAKRGAPAREVARIDRELDDLAELHRAQVAAERKAFEEAKAAKKVLDKRLKEDALLRIASVKAVKQNKSITLQTWGDRQLFAIPGSTLLFKTAEAMGGLPIIKQARQVWADTFISPTSRLPDDMQTLRGRALAEPHVVIKQTVERLQKTYAGMDRSVRENAFRAWTKGEGQIHPETQEAIAKTFAEFLPFVRNEVKVGDETFTIADFNKYLNGYGIEISPKRRITNPAEFISSIRPTGGGGRRAKNVPNMLRDPFELAWNLHVAKELALGRKGLQDNVKQLFGVRRGTEYNEHGKPLARILDDETTTVIEKLKKDHDWTPVSRVGENYLFPPEIAPDIERLFDMLEPNAIQDFAKLFDRATGGWKMLTTIYNPAYWTRNGLGEAMSSWLAGVHNPAWYDKSRKLISYARHDSKDFEAVADKLPGVKIKSNVERGKEIALTMNSTGQKVSYADVWAMAHDTGIKTNFFDTEFTRVYSKTGDKLRSAPVGKQAFKGHDTLRHGGEWYEDYFRMAHFMHSIEKSKARTLKGAASEAAKEVRKYHFDYTDFTQFEKAVMLRAFPFYKWTRKALPLMITMMFQKPGKVMGYNKFMNSYGNAMGNEGVVDDKTGFAPNYEGVVPDFIKEQWAYQIGRDAQGKDTYMNIATPQMDSYKALTNPLATATGLLNPLIKAPINEYMGHTMGNKAGVEDEFENDLNGRMSLEDKDSLKHLASYTPLSQLVERLVSSDGKYLLNDPDSGSLVPSEGIFKFLTGLGAYEDFYGKKESK